MSEDDEPAATLKKGGGRGRGGGFGYVFKQQFAKPFEKALKITMKSYSPPANNVFDAALTTQILTMLKTTFADLFRPVHENCKTRKIPRKCLGMESLTPSDDLCLESTTVIKFLSTLCTLCRKSKIQNGMHSLPNVRHAYGSPSEMNERWLRVQARRAESSKRKAPEAPAVNPKSTRPQRIKKTTQRP